MDPDDRRRHLVDSARRVFARKGYYETSVTDLIKEAGVARGTFYNYFESKRAVFQEVLVILGEELRTAALPIDVQQPIPPQVRANFARVIRACMRPEASKLLFAEAVGIDEEGDAALATFYADCTKRLAGSLRLGQALGVVGDGDMDLVAHMLIGMVKGPVHIAALENRELDADHVVDAMLSLLTRGLFDIELPALAAAEAR